MSQGTIMSYSFLSSSTVLTDSLKKAQKELNRKNPQDLLKEEQLLIATLNNDIDQVKTILETDINVNFQEPDGYTALLIAVERSNLELVELLLVHGADLSLKRHDGWSVFELSSDSLIYRTLGYKKPFSPEEKQELWEQDNKSCDDDERWDIGRENALTARQGQPFKLSHLKLRPTRTHFKPTPNEFQFIELENYFGAPLPHILVELFTHYNGSEPELDHFGDEGEGTIGFFYTLDEHIDSTNNIWRAIKIFAKDLGPQTLPFAEDYHGDIYFLKRIENKTQVWFYQYSDNGYDYDEEDYKEGSIPSCSTCIFDSLDELLEALYVPAF